MHQPNLLTTAWLSHPRPRDYVLVTFILLLVLLALRSFHPEPVVGIAWDQAKYLGTARTFPFHTLYNNELWLIHGPGFPALIRLGSLVLDDHAAAICVSIAMAVVTFWAIGIVGKVLRLGRTGVLLARMFLVLHPIYFVYAQEISKESAMVALYAMLLGGLMSSMCGSGRGRWLAAIAGGYFALTVDQHVPLVLISLGLVRVAWPQRTRRLGFIPLIPMLLIWVAILAVRLIRFTGDGLIPIGIDGMPEEAEHLGLMQAIFPNTSVQSADLELTNFKGFRANLAESGSFCTLFFWLRKLPNGLLYWHGALVLLIVLGAVRVCFFENRRRRWFGLGMILSTAVLFGVPMLIKPQVRYALLAVIPMACLVAMNVRWFPRRFMSGRPVWWAIAVCVVAAGAAELTAPSKLHFTLSRPLVVEAQAVADWFETHETRAVMAQVGYPPELAYLTDRRILGLPEDPKLLDEAIRTFDVSHIVVGSADGWRWDHPNRSAVVNSETIDTILAQPDAFQPVADVLQPAVTGRAADLFLIFQVDKRWLQDP